MNKYLSQEEKNTLKLEFAYQGQSSGMIGGYCEEGFPLYYANEDMAALLGYESVEDLAAAIGGKVVNTIHPDDMAQVERDLGGRFYEGMTYETTYRMLRRDGSWFWTVDKGKVVRRGRAARDFERLHGYERFSAPAEGARIAKLRFGLSLPQSAERICPPLDRRGVPVPLYRRALFRDARLNGGRNPHEIRQQICQHGLSRGSKHHEKLR